MLAIDHFVFPVASLGELKAHMERLGFTLAPRAEHPFGTANICLFLKGNVYIEFLALHDREVYDRALSGDYPFIRDMDGWRQRNGDEGFSGLAFASTDGHGDQARFERMGISGGQIGEFSREFALPDGTTDIASFRTVHTNLPNMAEIVCFTCQRVKVPEVDRSQLESHANGVQALRKIIISAPQPLDLRQSLTKLLDGPPSLAVPDALGFSLPNVELVALTPDAIAETYGIEIKTEVPRLVGLVLAVSSLNALEKQLDDNSFTYHKQERTPQQKEMIVHCPLKTENVFWSFET